MPEIDKSVKFVGGQLTDYGGVPQNMDPRVIHKERPVGMSYTEDSEVGRTGRKVVESNLRSATYREVAPVKEKGSPGWEPKGRKGG